MTAAELGALMLSGATLVSALASLIVAVRTNSLQHETHALVDGQSQGIQELREAKGRAEGMIAGRASTDPPPSQA